MGAWGIEPWENDYAADWFATFWCERTVRVGQELVLNFDHRDELQYFQIRAFATVLQSLGRPNIWPELDGVDQKDLIERTIEILENMINPELDDWTFLDGWPDETEVAESVRAQISELQKRNSEWIRI